MLIRSRDRACCRKSAPPPTIAWKRDELRVEKSMLLNLQLLRIATGYAVGRAAIASLADEGQERSDRIAEANKRAVALRGEQMLGQTSTRPPSPLARRTPRATAKGRSAPCAKRSRWPTLRP